MSDPSSLREFRHAIANVTWVVFGMVELLGEDHARGGLAPHMSGLASGSDGLREAVAPIFAVPVEALQDDQVDSAAGAIAAPLAMIDEAARRWLSEPAVEPAVARSLGAIIGATRDLRARFDQWSSSRAGVPPG